jgi:translation initiation factor IF-3
MEQLFKVANEVADLGVIKSHPSLEGRAMSMVIIPKKS